MQERGLKPPDDIMSCSRPLLDRRLKPHAEQAQKCPRCESTNTKFCYYNNYSLSQPRYFCKTCRRYWTKGGTLRNVPVGGGCRKNKRTKRASDQPVSAQNEASPSANTTGCEGPSCPTGCEEPSSTVPGASTSLYYSIASEGDELPGFAYARAPLGGCNSNNNTGSLQPSLAPLGSLSSLNALQSLKNSFPGLDLPSCSRLDQGPLNISDLSCLFEAHHQQQQMNTSTSLPISHVSDIFNPFSLPVDALNSHDHQWRGLVQQQKLGVPLEDGQVNLLPLGENILEGLRPHQQKLRQNNNAKLEDENLRTSGPPVHWQVPPEGFFETGGDSGYWNGGGTWPDLSGYGPSSSPLI